MASNSKRPAIVAADQAWERLGELLKRRRTRLGYKYRPPFAAARGINLRMVTDIESAPRSRVSFQVPTMQQIAEAYGVTYESIAAVLREEADELAPAQAAAVPAAGIPGAGLPMSAEARAAAAPYADRIWERLVDLAASGVTGPSGAQVFPGSPADARAWDVFAERRWPVPQRVWMVADLQAGDAPRPGREQDAAG